jgi:serine/threonine protein phosphatase PrpC
MQFAIVADGAGGPPAGDDAAEITITVLGGGCRATELAEDTQAHAVERFMKDLFTRADGAVKQEGVTYRQKKGLGAASVFMLRVGSNFHFLGAGDARIYSFDGANLTRRTTDHLGSQPNSISSAIGWLSDMSYQMCDFAQLFPGTVGVVLLCSDGLTKAVSDQAILQALKQGGTAKEICQRLMAKAKASGCRLDNISIIVILHTLP